MLAPVRFITAKPKILSALHTSVLNFPACPTKRNAKGSFLIVKKNILSYSKLNKSVKGLYSI